MDPHRAAAFLAPQEALSVDVPFTTPIATLQPTITGWTIVSAAGLLLLAAVYLLSISGEGGGKTLARGLSGLVVAGTLDGLWGVALARDVVAADLFWTMLTPMVAPLALTPIMAAQAGRVRLLVRRRKVRPSSYAELVEPRNEEARDRIRAWWENTALSRPKKSPGKFKCPSCGHRGRAPAGTEPIKCGGCGRTFARATTSQPPFSLT
ncbi:MAG: hypothetical protein IH956_06545 [Chloroflexi bacterium]|nr:hypothetical protein [Chloroflexota bacterium]